MRAAQYYAELSRAWAGAVTRYEMMWEIDLIEGYSMIHAAGILHGESYIWPDATLSSVGRKLLRLREVATQVQNGDWMNQIDL